MYFMRLAEDRKKFVVTADAVEYVERPTLLAAIKDAVGIRVYGDDNHPTYKPGDTVFIHPYHPPIPGTDVVLRSPKGDITKVVLGELKTETETEWHVHCYNRKEIDKYKKSEWTRCHRIVEKYNR